eukprot:7794798-Lingulodinium_polyedra.AAC.1
MEGQEPVFCGLAAEGPPPLEKVGSLDVTFTTFGAGGGDATSADPSPEQGRSSKQGLAEETKEAGTS